MKNPIQILVAISLCLLAGCKDEPEKIPTYLKIEPFEVDALGGAAWQKLSLAFVYVNTEFLGAYSFNKEFPILAEGEADVVVFPGVYANGSLEFPTLYSPLQRFDKKITLKPGETHSIRPTTKYQADTKFAWGDEGTFDNGTLAFVEADSDGKQFISFDSNNAFEGRSSRMVCDTGSVLNFVATNWLKNLPNTGQEIWFEMHYRCDAPFQLVLETRSILGNITSQPLYIFNKKTTWNKFYINLRDALISNPQPENRLVFRLLLPKDEQGKYTQETATLQLDNLKIAHF